MTQNLNCTLRKDTENLTWLRGKSGLSFPTVSVLLRYSCLKYRRENIKSLHHTGNSNTFKMFLHIYKSHLTLDRKDICLFLFFWIMNINRDFLNIYWVQSKTSNFIHLKGHIWQLHTFWQLKSTLFCAW